MPTGDLSDIRTGSSTLYGCLYPSCGFGWTPCSKFSQKNTEKTIKEVIDNYAKCQRFTPRMYSYQKAYFISDMSAAYVAYMNNIQNASSRTANTYGALSDDIEKERTELDQKLADIYKLDIGKLSEYKTHYESTLMSGLLWGTLAATVTYYVLYS